MNELGLRERITSIDRNEKKERKEGGNKKILTLSKDPGSEFIQMQSPRITMCIWRRTRRRVNE